MRHQVQNFADSYSNLGDDDLLRLDGVKSTLVPEARAALEGELKVRSLRPVLRPATANAVDKAPFTEHRPRFLILVLLRVGVCILLLIALAFFLALFPTLSNGSKTTDAWRYLMYGCGLGVLAISQSLRLSIKKTLICAFIVWLAFAVLALVAAFR